MEGAPGEEAFVADASALLQEVCGVEDGGGFGGAVFKAVAGDVRAGEVWPSGGDGSEFAESLEGSLLGLACDGVLDDGGAGAVQVLAGFLQVQVAEVLAGGAEAEADHEADDDHSDGEFHEGEAAVFRVVLLALHC